jgi:ParB-like chromosome segregation protein Spo0J
MIRAMTDAEARRAQVAENLQRVDVHPIEEAEGFEQMMANDGHTADTLAELVGKSRSYVYARLKLLQACAEVRKACLAGTITSEVALLIARLRTDKLQARALTAIKEDTSQAAKLDDGGKRSYRHIRDLLADRFTLKLAASMFDPEDATLVVSAGVCSACPKRSGNAPEFEDLAAKQREGEHGQYWAREGGPDLCTDPDCFAVKKEAHLARLAQQLTDTGAKVVTGNKAKQAVDAQGKLKPGYVPLAEVKAQLKKAGKGAQLPEVLTVINQRTGETIKAVKAEAVTAAGLSVKPQGQGSRGSVRDWQAEQREREAAAQAETERRRQVSEQLRPLMLKATGSTGELRLIALLALRGCEPEICQQALAFQGVEATHDVATQLEALAPLSADALRVLLLDLVLAQACDVNAYNLADGQLEIATMAALYSAGVPTPSTAGASAKGAASKGKAEPAKVARGVRYRDPMTGSTWSGKGLQPRWLKVALAAGRTLAEFDLANAKEVKVDAGAAGDRDTKTADLFAEVGA